MKHFYLFFLCFYVSYSYADQSETFIVEFGSEQVKVTSAKVKRKQYNIIIKNRTLLPLKGRVESMSRSLLMSVSVPAKKDRSYQFKWNPRETYQFLPLSPPFEAIKLEVAKSYYEIPPKK